MAIKIRQSIDKRCKESLKEKGALSKTKDRLVWRVPPCRRSKRRLSWPWRPRLRW